MIRGGLRARLITDSVRIAIIAGLTHLGWFDPTVHDDPPGVRSHLPLRYVPRPLKWDVAIEPNALAISTDDTRDMERGLGGEVEDRLRMYADVFAQNDEFGWQLTHDIRDILIGKVPQAGRNLPAIDVYDLRQPTPSPFTQVDVEGTLIDRAESESREWRNRWFMVRFDIVDEYYDEGVIDLEETWSPELVPIWQQIQAIEVN